MTSVHTPFRPLCNLSLATSEPDLTSARYNSSAIDILSHNIASNITISGPLALPSFVFPAKDSHVIPSPQITPTSDLTRLQNLSLTIRPEISQCTQDITQYEFSQLYPSKSRESTPISPGTSLPRCGFHKRGTSEFIGSDKSKISTSIPSRMPLKLDEISFSHSRSSIIQRRGHAHRRSAAISSGDLSIILRPRISPTTGGSLPNSPNFEHDSSSFLRSLPDDISKDEKHYSMQHNDNSTPIKSPKNSKVGFSDDVQIIPRPLSMASCDSISTACHSHSVSNSISSMVSASLSNSLQREDCSTDQTEPSRPRTAEPAFGNSEIKYRCHCPKRSESLPSLTSPMNDASNDVTTPRSLRRWTFFGNELINGGISNKLRPSGPSLSWCDQNSAENINYNTDNGSDIHINNFQETYGSERFLVSKNSTKKQKRVKSWAGSILSSKAKNRSHKYKPELNSPSLPKLITSSINVEPEEDVKSTPTCAEPIFETDYVNWKPRDYQSQDEAISPVIDLDAALGPFNTPNSRSGETWNSTQHCGTKKKAMHSAIGLGGFSGPGMHYHRRTESAPEFENLRFGLHRLGSSSKMTMEDVFEEDEDGELEDTKPNQLGVDLKIPSMKHESESVSRNIPIVDGLVSHAHSNSSEQESLITEQEISTKKLSQHGEKIQSSHSMQFPLSENVGKEKILEFDKSQGDAISKRQPLAQLTKFPALDNTEVDETSSIGLSSLSLHLSTPLSDSSSTPHITLPSPVSPFSYENQLNFSTQSSVLNQHEFESLLLGGPGPEMRISVDDVPSLMSSDSISGESHTTGENLYPNLAGEVSFRDGKRSASFSATIANRKRSSIISLSRLISSSHGEKSKLAIESHASSYSEDESQQKLANLGKRISRIIKFWRKSDSPQDSLTTL
ncbi:hypothetical protein HI914_01899 [Erysiphe necator]|nr:hypothetical protein HI914_01899 [Erysiphe necator]